MKTFLKLFLLCLPFISSAQNWELFNSRDRYNYSAYAPDISHVLFADSFTVSGTDTIYYPNRIVYPSNSSSIADTAFIDEPRFLLKKMIRSSNGQYTFINPDTLHGIYNWSLPDTFVIHANAGVGDSWLFDTVQNVTATVVAAGLSNVFGIPDSVKIILLDPPIFTILSSSANLLAF
ncbi:MAG: hypothetical protein JWO06_2880 [Bacteroidota bacterium]|nr:hypothetical protein [Bacteroidota bacterium]